MSRIYRCLLALGAAAVLVAGAACGGSTGGSKVNLDAQITGTKMTPDHFSAHLNDEVALTITADKAEEIHLHGYDYKFEMKPGEKQTKTFKADKSGHFTIEIEDSSTELGSLDVS